PFVTILGDGPLALVMAQLMVRQNATVRVVGQSPRAVHLCEKWRVKHRLLDDVGLRHDQDVVVDCLGTPSGFSRVLQMVRPRGKVVIKRASHVKDSSAAESIAEMLRSELQVIGSWWGGISDAVGVLNRREVDVSELIESRTPLEELPKMIDHIMRTDALKVIVEV
ncbi:MAG TPA: zinc-binding dehydrogenase, partial [Phycisphaerales bacterium]|nr:zinc-binding dehydrogenase [Phycisphaerales bacterium]